MESGMHLVEDIESSSMWKIKKNLAFFYSMIHLWLKTKEIQGNHHFCYQISEWKEKLEETEGNQTTDTEVKARLL